MSIPKKLSSIIPYIPNSRPKPKPPKKNVITISKRLTAVNDSIDWTVLFIAQLLVMVQQGTACRYLALLVILLLIFNFHIIIFVMLAVSKHCPKVKIPTK